MKLEEILLDEENYEEAMEQRVMPYLEKRKTELFWERGPGRRLYCVRYLTEQPRGIVLISHGFTEYADKYMEMAYYLLRAGYHVYIPEHCGHGHSYRLVKDMSLVHVDNFHRYEEDLLFTARHIKGKFPESRLFLLGHSMGGGIGAGVLAKEPDMFEKAVLTSPMIRPGTGPVPWQLVKIIAPLCCKMGQSLHYVAGHHPYKEKEAFEESAGSSKVRFEYQKKLKREEDLFHLSGASYGWLLAAVKLNKELRKTAWKNIKTPVLLFQAEKEIIVSKKEQEWFVRKLSKKSQGQCKLIKVPNVKHEIYMSDKVYLKGYLKSILAFFAEA